MADTALTTELSGVPLAFDEEYYARLQQEVDASVELDAAAPIILSLTDAIEQGQHLIPFGKIFLKNAFRNASPAYHYAMAEVLESTARQIGFKIFRGGSKTTILRAYCLQRICYGLSKTIMIVSASSIHSELTLRWIKKQIESNHNIITAFGVSKGDKWTDSLAEVRLVDGSTVTILAAGITGQVRGFNVDDYRPDLILLDDVQSDENVGKTQKKKTTDLVFGAVINSLAPETENPFAKVVALQTPMEEDDLIDIICKDDTWVTQTYGVFDGDGNSRWEERFPTQHWLRSKQAHIKRRQYSLWMREYECELVAGETQIFDVNNLRFYKELPARPRAIITAIDPASSEEKPGHVQSDHVTLTIMQDGPDVYVARYNAAVGQMPSQCANDFFTHRLAYRPGKLRVETIAFQKFFALYLKEQMTERRQFTPIEETGREDRRSKHDRISQSLAGLVAHGHLWVHESMLDLIEQMRKFAADYEGKMDIVDALSIANDGLDNPFEHGPILDGQWDELIAEEAREYGEIEFESGSP